MIRYALKCTEDHDFDSWFASGEAFDKLKAGGMVACPACGSTEVRKSLMSPGVRPGRAKAETPPKEKEAGKPRPLAARSELERKLTELRRQVEANSDYVGVRFAAEARKMHEGEAPHRSIYGEAKPEEARQLIEEGVPVTPLPFLPRGKTN
jgi:hypothetical protein